MTKAYQVVGIGNALVDVISHIEDGFLAENGVEQGIMQLIDRDRAVELYGRMGPAREISGGSAANTIAGIAALGGAHRLRRQGQGRPARRHLRPRPARPGRGLRHAARAAPRTAHETGRCMVLVSRDGERSMNTYLGVSEFLAPDDIDEAQMAAAEWIFLEGYRFDGPDFIAAFEKAVRADQAGRRQGRRSPSPTPSASSATATSSCA